MIERPILFSGPMVRAILDGRKTQTRRVVKLPHNNPLGAWEPMTLGGPNGGRTKDGHTIPLQGGIWHSRTGDCLMSPHGQPGDRLWVRETWQGPLFEESEREAYLESREDFYSAKYCEYAADGGPAPEFVNMDDELICRWRPSIHMPRWASRITLEVTGVRAERLQAISEADAVAEGCRPAFEDEHGIVGATPYFRYGYRLLWNDLNAARGYGWDVNPFVWVIEFRRVANGGVS